MLEHNNSNGNGSASPVFSFPQIVQVPQFYANAIGFNLTATDATIVFTMSGPVASVTVPYSVAKSLGNALKKVVEDYEERVGEPVQTVEALSEKITIFQTKKVSES